MSLTQQNVVVLITNFKLHYITVMSIEEKIFPDNLRQSLQNIRTFTLELMNIQPSKLTS